jgi:hypothetical protein
MKQKVIIIVEVPKDKSVHLWPEEFSLSSWEDRDYVSRILRGVDIANIEAIQLHHIEHISLRIVALMDK